MAADLEAAESSKPGEEEKAAEAVNADKMAQEPDAGGEPAASEQPAAVEENQEPTNDDANDVGEVPAAPEGVAAEAPAEAPAQAEQVEEGTQKEASTLPTMAKQEEDPDAQKKPSYTLHIRGLPADAEMDEVEMRLMRYGDVVSVQPQGEGNALVVAKFKRTNEAFEARQKLNGAKVCGAAVQVEFGPQDAQHYSRKKQKLVGKGGQRELADGGDKGPGGMRAWDDDADADQGEGGKGEGDQAGEDADDAAKPEAPKPKPAFSLSPPRKPVSKWSNELTFEQQLEDFMRMPRRNMYNRYLVLGKLPPELRSGEAIWRIMQPVQRDIVQIEMITCFGKPVSHVALRSATAAAAMHRLCEQMHPNLTVAFAPPRRASPTLWLGNVDDFVPRKELEELLGEFGQLVNGMRYLPVRTCAFASFTSVHDAVHARNTLYGLEVQRNQFLNVDFVDEGDQTALQPPPPMADAGWAAPWGAPWGAPHQPPPPWGAPPAPWGQQRPGAWGHPQHQQQWAAARGGDWRKDWRDPQRWGEPQQRDHRGGSPEHHRDRGEARARRRSRSRSARGRHSDQEPSPTPAERPKKVKRKAAMVSSPQGKKESDSEELAPPPTKSEKKGTGKAKVKLFKMGEFCCNIVANYVRGKESPESITTKLAIDQRTKIDHCKVHLERAGKLATVWHFSAADRRDCAAYDALCDYFVEKQRVGLVQTPSYYVYIIPPTDEYFKALDLPPSNFVVGLQIPLKK